MRRVGANKRGIWLVPAITLLGICSSVARADISFTDATASSGVSYSGKSWSIAVGDWNDDGALDIFTSNHAGTPPTIFVNNGNGIFSPHDRDLLPIPHYNYKYGDDHGTAWADIDNDGDQDILQLTGGRRGVTGEGEPNLLFVNEGDVFSEQGASRGIDYYYTRGRVPTWLDWDDDGDLDVFVASFRRTDGLDPTALFIQDDAGNFSPEYLITDNHHSFSQVSRLLGDERKFLLVTGPNNKFPFGVYEFGSDLTVDLTDQVGLPRTTDVSDVAIADFTGDALVDVFLVRSDSHDELADRFLTRLNGQGEFVNRSGAAGLEVTGCQSIGAGDFDNDGDLDAYLSCGLYDQGVGINYPNILYENQGGGVFKRAPAAGGAEGTDEGCGEGVAVADFNNDGFLDLFVTNGKQASRGPNQLFLNTTGNGNHWVKFELQGVASNRDAIGARVKVFTGNEVQLREQDGGMHWPVQNGHTLHFGLGAHQVIDRVVVEWPSGIVQELADVAVDTRHTIVENDGLANSVSVSDVTVAESAGVASIAVTLSDATDVPVTVDYALQDSSAVTPDDYLAGAATGSLTIPAGDVSVTLVVEIFDDVIFEGDENFRVALSNPVNGYLNDALGVVTILDNEAPDSTAACGEPVIRASTEKGVFLWQDCPSGAWHVRATAGGPSKVTYRGQVVAEQPIASAPEAFSLEGADFLDTDNPPLHTAFRFNVVNNGRDGFDFAPSASGQTCFNVESPADAQIYLGADKSTLGKNIDLSTLAPCL